MGSGCVIGNFGGVCRTLRSGVGHRSPVVLKQGRPFVLRRCRSVTLRRWIWQLYAVWRLSCGVLCGSTSGEYQERPLGGRSLVQIGDFGDFGADRRLRERPLGRSSVQISDFGEVGWQLHAVLRLPSGELWCTGFGWSVGSVLWG